MKYVIVESTTGKVHFSTPSEWIANEMFNSYKTSWGRYQLLKIKR